MVWSLTIGPTVALAFLVLAPPAAPLVLFIVALQSFCLKPVSVPLVARGTDGLQSDSPYPWPQGMRGVALTSQLSTAQAYIFIYWAMQRFTPKVCHKMA